MHVCKGKQRGIERICTSGKQARLMYGRNDKLVSMNVDRMRGARLVVPRNLHSVAVIYVEEERVVVCTHLGALVHRPPRLDELRVHFAARPRPTVILFGGVGGLGHVG